MELCVGQLDVATVIEQRYVLTFMTIRGAGRMGSVALRPVLDVTEAAGMRFANGSDSGPDFEGACPALRKSPSRGTTAMNVN